MRSDQSGAMETAATDACQTPNLFRTCSPEQAIHFCQAASWPHKLTLLGPSKDFGFTQRPTRAGPITLAELMYDTDVSLHFVEERDSYYIHVPIKGLLESRHRGREVISTPVMASVYRPHTDMTVTRWPGGTRHLGIKIDRLAVDTALESLLGRPLDTSIAFASALPMRDRAAQSWVRQLGWVLRELADPDSPMRHPAVLDPIVESVISGFLFVADHPHRAALLAPAGHVRTDAVRLAIDIIESSPQSPLTTASLAAQCHLSIRALQAGFRRGVGMSPTSYIRRVRLRRANRDLRLADPRQTSVKSIAHRWGFNHLGRFSLEYKAIYGEAPHETLRTAH
jgi:AraC-like DNA-binding protein